MNEWLHDNYANLVPRIAQWVEYTAYNAQHVAGDKEEK